MLTTLMRFLFFDKQLDMNPYHAESSDLVRNLERMKSASSAPYRILLNHMGLLDSRREVFHSVSSAANR